MSAHILDGKALSISLNKDLKRRIQTLERPPGLAVVLVGDDPASQVYVGKKGKVAKRIGFFHRQVSVSGDISQAELEAVVDGLVADEQVDGILVQMPLPEGLSASAVMERIPATHDVDGLTITNTGRLSQGKPGLVACTPSGVMRLLEEADLALQGLHAVVIGRSNIVGRPMAMLLEQANCTVTVCHSRTRDLPAITRQADVVVSAVGRPRFVTGDWIKPGAAVIDVGICRLSDGSLCGDVDFDSVRSVAGWLTPVPGGVGPMTIAMLMENTYQASCFAQGVVPIAAYR